MSNNAKSSSAFPKSPSNPESSPRDRLASRMVQILPSFGVWATTIRDFETPYGKIGLRQAEVLYALRHGLVSEGPVSPSMLSEHFCVQPSAITRVLNRLEGSDYIERRIDPSDGRAQTIHLTARGEAISIAVEQVFAEQMQEAITRIPEGDVEGMLGHIEMLGEIVQALLRMQGRPVASSSVISDIRSERGYE
ncbi:MAG: MarR family transcriptional regulator [Thermomicrobiales bacterium]